MPTFLFYFCKGYLSMGDATLSLKSLTAAVSLTWRIGTGSKKRVTCSKVRNQWKLAPVPWRLSLCYLGPSKSHSSPGLHWWGRTVPCAFALPDASCSGVRASFILRFPLAFYCAFQVYSAVQGSPLRPMPNQWPDEPGLGNATFHRPGPMILLSLGKDFLAPLFLSCVCACVSIWPAIAGANISGTVLSGKPGQCSVVLLIRTHKALNEHIKRSEASGTF